MASRPAPFACQCSSACTIQLRTKTVPVLQDAGRNVKLHLGRSSILVRDALRRPLLEAEIGSVAASLSQRSQHVSQVRPLHGPSLVLS